jgi:ubiquinone/menaquinone biosynthesis C-methylase UbiE
MFVPVTQALVKDAAISRGESVLDVGTGTGEPALSIAELVGAEGRVVGTDPVPEMVEAARREGHRRGLHNATFEAAFSESLPFRANTFDVVVSRFGVMFFASPVDSLREWLRVLKPGGRMAASVWHFAEKNPFHYVAAKVVERYVESPPAIPGAPDAFRFATPGKLQAIFSEAGVTEMSERLLQFSIQAPISAENLWKVRCEMSEKLRTKLSKLSKQQIEAVNREVTEAVGAYSSEGGVSFPAEVLIVSGRKQLAE